MAQGYVRRILDSKKIETVLREIPLFCGEHAGDRLTDKAGAAGADTSPTGAAQSHRHMPSAARVSYFDLRPDVQANGAKILNLHIEHQATSAVHTSGSAAKELRPIFYLPYETNRMTRMKLSQPEGYAGPEVRFFATDTINGCSVYVEGPPQTPHVTHGNASDYRKIESDTWAVKTQKIQAKSAFMDQRFGGVRKSAARVVERSDYMISREADIPVYVGQFARAMRIPEHCVYPESYNPIGAVVGLKTNGTWRFYVQRCCSMDYHRDGRTRAGESVRGVTQGFAVLGVSELWPGGAGQFRTV